MKKILIVLMTILCSSIYAQNIFLTKSYSRTIYIDSSDYIECSFTFKKDINKNDVSCEIVYEIQDYLRQTRKSEKLTEADLKEIISISEKLYSVALLKSYVDSQGTLVVESGSGLVSFDVHPNYGEEYFFWITSGSARISENIKDITPWINAFKELYEYYKECEKEFSSYIIK